MSGRATNKRREPPRPTLSERVKGLPTWLTAIAAVGGTLVAAAGVYVAATNDRPPPAPTAPPPSVIAPRVTIESVLVDSQQVQADGDFQYLDPTREEVLFIGRPSGSEDDAWVAVEADLTPREQLGALQSGDWTASRPAPPQAPYRWRVIVWPAGSGATANEDLQLNGPDSQYVIARSEEWLDP